jgi:YD repeat-containing protein
MSLYTYDKLNRVVKAEYSDGFFEEFSYDGTGNRRSKTTPQGTTVYEYDEENRLRKAGDMVYVYDPAGNLIEKSSPGRKATYKYDFDNRLIFYSDELNQVTFEYDGNGNRISKTANGVRTEYVNDRKKISESGDQRNISDIPGPGLIGMINNKIPQQIGEFFMLPARCA